MRKKSEQAYADKQSSDWMFAATQPGFFTVGSGTVGFLRLTRLLHAGMEKLLLALQRLRPSDVRPGRRIKVKIVIRKLSASYRFRLRGIKAGSRIHGGLARHLSMSFAKLVFARRISMER